MTLIEAHKTGRNYRRVKDAWSEFYRHGDLDDILISDALADDYELEPEVYKEIVVWEEFKNLSLDKWAYIIYPRKVTPRQTNNFFEKVLGKRTKITIEVLD